MLNQAGSGGFPGSNKVAIFVYFIFKVQLALCSQVSNPQIQWAVDWKYLEKNLRKFQKQNLNFPHSEHCVESTRTKWRVGISCCSLDANAGYMQIRHHLHWGFSTCGFWYPRGRRRVLEPTSVDIQRHL